MAATKTGETERIKLSRAAVVERALELADNDGLGALTIRRLAAALGVTPMALYWHFRSKEELTAGLAERVWGEIRTDVDRTSHWSDQLRMMLLSLLDVLHAHPSASALLLAGEKLGQSGWQATETTLDILRGAGFDAQHASEIAKSALWTGLTLVMSEPGFDARLSPPERAEAMRRKQVELASLPPDRYPRLVEAAVPMTSCEAGSAEFHYRLGVDLFIAGVRALAPGS
jgi:TetR/AcrR family transcriptional regulator, tetracycline repressor protein